MPKIEQLELEAYSAQLEADVNDLVKKYRAIFGWDVPDVDEALSERLILTAIRQALDGREKKWSDTRSPS
jgi:hypothetical protein